MREWPRTERPAGEGASRVRPRGRGAAPRAELFLNGISLGSRRLADSGKGYLSWDIAYEPGLLEAVVSGPGITRLASSLRTAGPAADLELAMRGEILRTSKSLDAFLRRLHCLLDVCERVDLYNHQTLPKNDGIYSHTTFFKPDKWQCACHAPAGSTDPGALSLSLEGGRRTRLDVLDFASHPERFSSGDFQEFSIGASPRPSRSRPAASRARQGALGELDAGKQYRCAMAICWCWCGGAATPSMR